MSPVAKAVRKSPRLLLSQPVSAPASGVFPSVFYHRSHQHRYRETCAQSMSEKGKTSGSSEMSPELLRGTTLRAHRAAAREQGCSGRENLGWRKCVCVRPSCCKGRMKFCYRVLPVFSGVRSMKNITCAAWEVGQDVLVASFLGLWGFITARNKRQPIFLLRTGTSPSPPPSCEVLCLPPVENPSRHPKQGVLSPAGEKVGWPHPVRALGLAEGLSSWQRLALQSQAASCKN